MFTLFRFRPFSRRERKEPSARSRSVGAGAVRSDATVQPVELARRLICPWCGQEHRAVALRHRQRAMCVRCGTVLATRSSGRSGALAYAVTGLLLTPPAVLLPFVTVDKLGAERVTRLLTGVSEIWSQGMHWLGVWVLVCGVLGPVLLLATLAALMASGRRENGRPRTSLLARTARALEKWAMPEVHVLAVLVAFTKLDAVVNVSLGGGFWCYAAMSLSFLLAWRSLELDPRGEPELTAAAALEEIRA